MSSYKHLRNVLLNKFGMLIQIATAFVLTPLLIHFLGDERYGIWVIIASLTGYLSLVDFGISSSVIRFVSQFSREAEDTTSAEEDQLNARKIRQLLGSATLILIAISAVLILIAPFIGREVLSWFIEDSDTHALLNTLLLIICIDVSVFIFNNTFRAALEGRGRFDLTALLVIISVLGKALGMYCVLYIGFGLTAMVLVSLATNILLVLGSFTLIKRNYPALSFNPLHANRRDAKEVLRYGRATFFAMLANQVIYYTDTFIVAFFLGPIMVAYYAIPWSLMEYTRQLFVQASRSFVPSFSHESSQNKNISDLYIQSTRWLFLASNLICIGLMVFGADFIRIWINDTYAEQARWLIIIFFAGQLIQTPQLLSYALLQGLSQHKRFATLSLYTACANLALSLILVQFYGVEGVAIGAAIPQAIFYLFFVPTLTLNAIGESGKRYFNEAILPGVGPSIVLLAVALFIKTHFQPDSFLNLLLAAFVCGIVYLTTIWFLTLSGSEKNKVTQIVKSRLPI